MTDKLTTVATHGGRLVVLTDGGMSNELRFALADARRTYPDKFVDGLEAVARLSPAERAPRVKNLLRNLPKHLRPSFLNHMRALRLDRYAVGGSAADKQKMRNARKRERQGR